MGANNARIGQLGVLGATAQWLRRPRGPSRIATARDTSASTISALIIDSAQNIAQNDWPICSSLNSEFQIFGHTLPSSTETINDPGRLQLGAADAISATFGNAEAFLVVNNFGII